MATPDDAGVVRIDETTGRGIALALDGNGRFAALDPYAGAQLALSEAYRNVGVSGAVPIAVTDCLNAGSPEEPGAMWQFAEVVRALADASVTLGTPVTGGNVSFYNSTGDTAIHPTPVVGVLGVLDDVDRRIGSGWAEAGLALYVLGTTREELSGSAWAGVVHDHLGGLPPQVDLAAEQLLASVMLAASRDGLVDAAHDLSDGGLAQALVEGCLRHGVGARVWLDGLVERDGVDLTTALFSESAARAVVAVPRSEEIRFTDVATARGLPHVRIGVTDDAGGADGEPVLEVGGVGAVGARRAARGPRGDAAARCSAERLRPARVHGRGAGRGTAAPGGRRPSARRRRSRPSTTTHGTPAGRARPTGLSCGVGRPCTTKATRGGDGEGEQQPAPGRPRPGSARGPRASTTHIAGQRRRRRRPGPRAGAPAPSAVAPARALVDGEDRAQQDARRPRRRTAPTATVPRPPGSCAPDAARPRRPATPTPEHEEGDGLRHPDRGSSAPSLTESVERRVVRRPAAAGPA